MQDASQDTGGKPGRTPSIERSGEERSGQVRSLVRGLTILNIIANYPEGATLSQIGQDAGLSAATTHRLLTTLEQEQYVRFDTVSRRWLMGLQAYLTGMSYTQTRGLLRIASPFMEALFSHCQETVNLAVEEHGSIVYLNRLRLRLEAMPDELRLPLHRSGLGKAMLSAQADPVLSRMLPLLRGKKDAAGTRALLNQIEQVRHRGYAIDDEELTSGLRCVAAPILDARRRPVAALSVSGPSERMSAERLLRLGTLVRQTADKITVAFGGKPH
jgi:IclR family acetate operon transcriptional repressor